MPKQTFVLNGKSVTVDVEDDVRLLWVIRDIVGLTGPKYGCGINVCKACTSHLNGKAFNPCAVRVADVKDSDEVTTIEGLADTVDDDLHPMQEAWLEYDVAQCGYCQPGQIMAAVATVRKARAEGRDITEADLDGIRNVCRCGTYSRIREAIKAGAARPCETVSRGRGPRAAGGILVDRHPTRRGDTWSAPPPTPRHGTYTRARGQPRQLPRGQPRKLQGHAVAETAA